MMLPDNEMSIYDHIGELRKRLIIIAVFFFIAFAASFFLVEPLITFLQSDIPKGIKLIAGTVTSPITVYMQLAFFISIIIISPVILYQLWAFVSPGLYEKEQKATLKYIPVAVFLFLSGISFSYFVLRPYVVTFMSNLAEKFQLDQLIDLNSYFSFLIQLTLPFGVVFELPVVIMFLTRLGVVTPMFLSKIRKYAYFALLILAGIISPPDVISQVIVMIPLVILYEVSLTISKVTYRKMLIAEQREANS